MSIKFAEKANSIEKVVFSAASRQRPVAQGLTGLRLTGEREHVGSQPRTKQHRGVELSRTRMRGGLVQNGGQRVEASLEHRERGFGQRHAVAPLSLAGRR